MHAWPLPLPNVGAEVRPEQLLETAIAEQRDNVSGFSKDSQAQAPPLHHCPSTAQPVPTYIHWMSGRPVHVAGAVAAETAAAATTWQSARLPL